MIYPQNINYAIYNLKLKQKWLQLYPDGKHYSIFSFNIKVLYVTKFFDKNIIILIVLTSVTVTN